MRVFLNSVTHWDILYFSKIFHLNNKKMLPHLFAVFSRSGNGYLYPAIGGILFFTHPDIAMDFLITTLMAFAVELPSYKILKNCIKRHRPFETLPGIQKRITPSDRFSLPSGHTAAAFLMATLLAYYLPLLILPAYFWASGVALSRIYLGLHYPTDILAGVVLGIFSALMVLVLVN